METSIKIYEVGKLTREDGTYVLLRVVQQHNRHIVSEVNWRAPWDMEIEQIGKSLIALYDADRYEYQSLFFLLEVENYDLPLRYLGPIG